MKKGLIISLIGIVTILGVLAVFKYGMKFYEEQRVKNATIIVELVDDLEIDFDTDLNLSDLIEEINGTLIDDVKIDTISLGEQTIDFEYINDEDIRVPYSFKINVVDKVEPLVWLGGSYSVTTKFDGALEEKILCADNYDDEPVCKVEGEYDTTVPGRYDLTFVATDSSGNEKRVPFVLNVSKPASSSGSSSTPSNISFETAIERYKNENTALGIDVSSWQGDVNFESLKNAGVEFAFVRVGSKWGTDGDYFVDSKFERNIKGFNEVGIPVGIYFYSYAKNEKEAISDAKWVIDKVRDYEVDLPIAYDFEDWSRYNQYKMSLYRLNRNAEVFIETLENAGYDGMLYSSLSYLDKMWDEEDKTVWLAHYTSKTSYEGDYAFWQFTNRGRVDGIYGDVDLNVMYKKGE